MGVTAKLKYLGELIFQPLYIKWNDSNSVGIPIIDEQHRGIVTIVNSLHYLIRSGRAMDTLGPILNVFEHLALLHFETEEGLFVNSGFPECKEHIQAHRNFFPQAQAAAREASSNGDTRIELDFLKKWWLGHINTEDKKYTQYCKR